MKILLLAPQPFYQERGTPLAVKLLAQTLAEQGHVVHLLVFAEGQTITLPGVTIHRHISLPGISGVKPGLSLKKLLCDFFFFIKCLGLVKKHEFQLVHAVEESVFMALVLKKLWKIPYVYDMDSCMSMQLVDKFPSLRLLRRVMEWLEKSAVVNSKGVVAVCRTLEEMARNYAPDALVARIEDVTLLEQENSGTENLRKELGIEGVLLMYVGNLEKYQGIDLLLDAFQEALLRKGDLALVCIGGSDIDIQAYQQRTSQLALDSRVFFCGRRPVDLLGHYLRQADILVSPRTLGNNTPMKIYSYLDSGRPVLATHLPTHTQVLDKEIACLVAPTKADMADGIVTLASNRELREQIGARAKKRVEEEYSLPAFQRKLARFYEKLTC